MAGGTNGWCFMGMPTDSEEILCSSTLAHFPLGFPPWTIYGKSSMNDSPLLQQQQPFLSLTMQVGWGYILTSAGIFISVCSNIEGGFRAPGDNTQKTVAFNALLKVSSKRKKVWEWSSFTLAFFLVMFLIHFWRAINPQWEVQSFTSILILHLKCFSRVNLGKVCPEEEPLFM